MSTTELMSKMDELLGMTKEAFEHFAEQTERIVKAQRPMPLATDEDSADPAALALDMAVLRAAPIAAVPAHAEFTPLKEAGHRFLLAQDGLYLEVRRPWIYAIHRLAEHKGVHIPYGPIRGKVELAFGKVGTAMPQLRDFAVHAIAAAPNESAASVIWNSSTGDWRIAYPELIGHATPDSIQFKQVDLEENEHLVIDLHSHGNGPAFFSGTDDQDDAGCVKISGVYGMLDSTSPTAVMRLCLLGAVITIPAPADQIFA